MVPLAENAGMLEGELPLHIQAVQYWTAHSYPVELVKDSCIFYTYVTDHQMHINKICFFVYCYSPTCFGYFYDHHQGAVQEHKQYISFLFLYFISVHLLVCYISIKLSLMLDMEHVNSRVYVTELQ